MIRSKELVKLHGGTLTVSSVTVAESPDEHGSIFTTTIPLGKDHLPPSHIIQGSDDFLPQSRTYARGIVDEAVHWSNRTPNGSTPSESSDSGGSSEGGRMDPSTLFFLKSDVILLGQCITRYPFASNFYVALLVDDSVDMRRVCSQSSIV